VPAATPVTIPVLPTVAVPVAVELHTPPAIASLRVVMPPASQTHVVPDIAVGFVGKGFTVITTVVAMLPQPFVSV